MKRAKNILVISLLLAPLIYVACRITVLNPAWMIGMKYPDSKRQLHTVNSPDLHFWSAIAGLFGIPMTDSDHSLTVTLDGHPSSIRLDDFSEADELYVKNSRVSDISAYLDPSVRLSGVVFVDCDFTPMSQEQRELLKAYSAKVPNSYYVPYEEKQRRNKRMESNR